MKSKDMDQAEMSTVCEKKKKNTTKQNINKTLRTPFSYQESYLKTKLRILCCLT